MKRFALDAWIAACAAEHGAMLLHKDPEFSALPIAQEFLPLKPKLRRGR